MLTEAEWRRLLPFLDRMKPQRREAVYNRLVLGMTLAASGEAFGYSRQDVSIMVRRVMAKHAKLANLQEQPSVPKGWSRVHVVVPTRQLDNLRRIVGALYPSPDIEPLVAAEPRARWKVKPGVRKQRTSKK